MVQFSYVARFTLTLTIVTCAAVSGIAGTFDRQAHHDRQVGVPNLTERGWFTNNSGQQQTASVVAPDVRISEAVAPSMFTQDNVSLARAEDLTWLAAWEDERLGAFKIFLQRIDSTGAPVGDNRLMASSQAGADYVEPALAVDTLGRVYLFWRDRTNGIIYGSRYNADLTANIAPFIINDTTGGAFAGLYDAAVYPDGRFVVVWEDYSITGNTIQMRIYSSAGAPVTGPSIVNSNGGSTAHWAPSVAVQPSGGFLVVWEDYSAGNADVIARLFTGAGVPVAAEFGLVPPLADDSAQYAPQVAYSTAAQYVIGWIDLRSGQEVFLQQYNPTTGLVGSNVLISTGNLQLVNWDLDVTVSPDGGILAAWGAYGQEASIVAGTWGTDLAPRGVLAVHSEGSVGQRWAPSAEYFSVSKYGIAWTEAVDDDEDIAFMMFDTTGAPLWPAELTLNDDSVGAPSLQPDIAAVTNWYDLVTFTSERHDAGDIYVQLVSHATQTVRGNWKLNTDAGSALQHEPSIAPGRDSNLVVWVDSRSVSGVAGQRIFGRFVSDYGYALGGDFVISNPLNGSVKGSPSAAINTSGRILTAWLEYNSPGGVPDVKARWLTAAGQPDGTEFLIGNSATESVEPEITVGTDVVGRMYVVYHAVTDTGSVAVVTWFNADKSAGGTVRYELTNDDSVVSEMVSAVSQSGVIALLWVSDDPVTGGLYLAAIDRSGAQVLAPMSVDQTAATPASDIDVSIDEHDYISAVWVDWQTGVRRVYYQVVTTAGALVGGNQQISSTAAEYQVEPAAASAFGRLWVAWVDPRQDGDNVWGNLVLYLPTDVDPYDGTLPGTFALHQNYPNPFNPTTEIRFELPKKSRVTLEVFNLLGQKVATLASGEYAAGEHVVTWNAEGIGSGVYLYRLQAGGKVQTRKMVVVR